MTHLTHIYKCTMSNKSFENYLRSSILIHTCTAVIFTQFLPSSCNPQCRLLERYQHYPTSSWVQPLTTGAAWDLYVKRTGHSSKSSTSLFPSGNTPVNSNEIKDDSDSRAAMRDEQKSLFFKDLQYTIK